jgi:hypothetical protein
MVTAVVPTETTGQVAADREALRPLVEEAAALAAEPEQAQRKELWARHQALRGSPKVPVCVSYEGIPPQQWEVMFGTNHLRATTDLGREIEFELKRRLWIAHEVPDDHIVWPYITVTAVTREVQDWGVPIEWREPDDPLGAKGIVAPFADLVDVARLTQPVEEVDEAGTARRLDLAR